MLSAFAAVLTAGMICSAAASGGATGPGSAATADAGPVSASSSGGATGSGSVATLDAGIVSPGASASAAGLSARDGCAVPIS